MDTVHRESDEAISARNKDCFVPVFFLSGSPRLRFPDSFFSGA